MSDPTPLRRPRRPPVKTGFDPREQPAVVANIDLDALPESALTPDALRAALSPARAWSVPLPGIQRDAPYPGREVPVLAAVLLALVMRPEGVRVVLTERASHLHDHAGQISFPGGRIEETDASPEAAALREAQDETGLPPAHVEVLGTMAPYVTATGFSITPVVGLVRPGFSFVPDEFEVAEIFEVPLAFLMDPANHMHHRLALPEGRSRHFFSMTWERFFVWGATAGMLRNFYHLLRQAQTTAY